MNEFHFHDRVNGQNTVAGLHASQGGSINVNFNAPDKLDPDAEACRRDLFLTDPLEDKKALKREKGDRASGTFEWILDTKELTTWLGSRTTENPETQESHVLWLHGNPGTGKSTMAMFLTESLLENFSKADEKTLAVFFCDSSFDARRTATSIVRGLLYQFIQQHSHLLGYLLPKYKERREKLFESFDALWSILMEIGDDQNTGQKYCIIDALDECNREDQEILLRQLQETFQGQNSKPNIWILVTSRPYTEICEYLEEFVNKDLASFPGIEQDIYRFIQQRTEYLAKRKRYTDNIKKEISNILRDRAEGTFLWVGLASKELESVSSKDAIQTLQKLPKGLNSLYKRLLDTFEEDQEGGISQIRRILAFVAVCLHPLSVLELSEACQLFQDVQDTETRVQFTHDQISSCRLMAVVQGGRVLLLHQSVKDFLVGAEAGNLLNELEAHAQLAYRCIDVITERFCGGYKANTSFSNYATYTWPIHARMAQSGFELKGSQMEFFEIESPCREYWLELYYQHHDFQRAPMGVSILHVAAWWGIAALVEKKHFEEGKLVSLINVVDNSGTTPLEYAVLGGHIDTIRILLNLGGKVTTQALENAAMPHIGDGEIMALLLSQRGYQFAIADETLMIAAMNWSCALELVSLLLDQPGNQITITNEVIEAAARNSRSAKEVITFLLGRRGGQITPTEHMLRAAAANVGSGIELMQLFLGQCEGHITLTKETLEAAAGNRGSGMEIIQLLLGRCEGQITLTETILKSVATNEESGGEVMRLLLDQYGDQIALTEEILKAAVANKTSGREITRLLIGRCGDQVTITKKIARVALVRRHDGEEIIQLLLHSAPSSAAIIGEARREIAELRYKYPQAFTTRSLS